MKVIIHICIFNAYRNFIFMFHNIQNFYDELAL